MKFLISYLIFLSVVNTLIAIAMKHAYNPYDTHKTTRRKRKTILRNLNFWLGLIPFTFSAIAGFYGIILFTISGLILGIALWADTSLTGTSVFTHIKQYYHGTIHRITHDVFESAKRAIHRRIRRHHPRPNHTPTPQIRIQQ